MIFAMLVGIILFAGALSSAETVSFGQSTTVGNMSNSALDIVMTGGFTSGEYQYFYADTRSSGLATPPDGSTYQFAIYVNGAEEEQYLLILLSCTNNVGNIAHFYRYSLENSKGSPLESGAHSDIGKQNNGACTAILLSNVSVLSVKFITVNYNTTGTDMATYCTQSGASGEDTDTMVILQQPMMVDYLHFL